MVLLSKKKYDIVKNEPNLQYKGKSAYITQAISQKDTVQKDTNVSLPDDDNVEEARDWVNFNKK
jgi:hypothetical protein